MDVNKRPTTKAHKPEPTIRELGVRAKRSTVEKEPLSRTESEFGYTVERTEMVTRGKKEETFSGQVSEEEFKTGEWIVEGSERDNLPDKRDRIAREVLREIDSFEDAAAAFLGAYGESPLLISKTELGDGFTHYRQKETAIKEDLVDVPLFIIEYEFGRDAESGRELVFIRAMAETKRGRLKLTFTDASTGIFAQLKELAEITGKKGKARRGGILVPHGLRFSEYLYSSDLSRAVSEKEAYELREQGKTVEKAKTFYLDTRGE